VSGRESTSVARTERNSLCGTRDGSRTDDLFGGNGTPDTRAVRPSSNAVLGARLHARTRTAPLAGTRSPWRTADHCASHEFAEARRALPVARRQPGRPVVSLVLCSSLATGRQRVGAPISPPSVLRMRRENSERVREPGRTTQSMPLRDRGVHRRSLLGPAAGGKPIRSG